MVMMMAEARRREKLKEMGMMMSPNIKKAAEDGNDDGDDVQLGRQWRWWKG